MFKVFVNDGTQKMPKDDILYIVCKEGVYLKKKVGIMESITPVKGLSHLDTVETMARMHIDDIPGFEFAKIIDFFRAVFKEHQSEAVVLLFYDMETGEYEILAPAQEVSGGGADYVKGISIEGMDMIGTIHSHARMSAFHSGIDDKDEESFDGIHITIGDLDEEFVSISSSIVSNGTRFMTEPEDYIKDLTKVVDIDEEVDKPYRRVFKMVGGKLVESKTSYTYSYRKYDKRYKSKFLKPSKEPQGIFDEKWLENVEHKIPIYTYGWGGSFDPLLWKEKLKQKLTTPATKQPTKALVPVASKPILKNPTIDPKTEMNPCSDCVFKGHKIDWVLEQISEGIDVEEDISINNHILDETSMLDTYHCEKCESIFQTETLDVVCPICKTDEHLIDITGEVDLTDTKMLDADFSQLDEAGFDSESEKIEQSKADSGEFLDPEYEAVMEAAEEADAEIERLPIPGEDTTPIQTKEQGVFSFMQRKRKRKKKSKKK